MFKYLAWQLRVCEVGPFLSLVSSVDWEANTKAGDKIKIAVGKLHGAQGPEEFHVNK